MVNTVSVDIVKTKQFIILDLEQEPLRKFYHKRDAEWFIKDKPDCTIKTILTEQLSTELSHEEFTAKYGEPLF